MMNHVAVRRAKGSKEEHFGLETKATSADQNEFQISAVWLGRRNDQRIPCSGCCQD